jgi:DNA-directed RNA polymerase specialized sigma24 family protein
MSDAEARIRLAEKVLNELGERCRELLLFFYTGGMKLKDIAVKMGYNSENTAKNQKYKCLEAAKNRLKELKQSIQIV